VRAVLITEAELDLSKAARWYQSQAGLEEAFIAAVVDALIEIERHPRRYPGPPGYRGRHDVHRLLLDRFPYSIVYQILPNRLRVVAVAHVRRRPRFWERRLI
jgi:toxin ParE1/3/4